MPMAPGSSAPASSSGGGGSGGTVTTAVLANDLSKTNDTLANLTGLTFAIAANEVWQVDIYIGGEWNSPGDAKLSCTMPANCAVTVIASNAAISANAATIPVILSSAFGNVKSSFTFANEANAGNVQFQFAQNTTDATPSTASALFTYMIARKVSA